MATQAGLPSGIVTFVFTDVESSTRMMRRVGDPYAELSERHMAIMRESWQEHHGAEIGTAGDSVFVAFDDPNEAVKACADAQDRLDTEPWPDDCIFRVRMGIHSGLAVPRDDNYAALAVNQAARVMSAAHGGQVLISEQTAALLTTVALAPVGRYRVRDFDDPVHLYTLPGHEDFPAVRALPADGHNLVQQPTRLFGRDRDVADVAGRLEAGRMVTLTGPGGVGKTRLAVQVGSDVAAQWPDGVWMVDLAPVHEPALIGAAAAEAVGAPGRSGDRWADLVDHLLTRRALLVFDNCEHLRDACARAIDELLVLCPMCGVMATSREPLAIAREIVHRVPPLPESPALQLLIDRATAAGTVLALDAGTVSTLTRICDRLDGLPLAIELAAARLSMMRPDDVLDGLDDRFRLLRSRNEVLPERQRTMQGLLEWSERLLSPAEQACLRRLAVFGANFTIPAATVAAGFGAVDEYDVPELVWSLVDKSLVVADIAANETRYHLLESVREYAFRRLDEMGETAETAGRVAGWFGERVGPAQRHSGDWVSEVTVDVDNLRSLIPLLESSAPERAHELAYVIARYSDSVQAYYAGVEELTRHIDQAPTPTPARISLFTTLGDLNLRVGRVDAAARALAAAEALREQVGSVPEWDDVAIERTRGELAIRRGDNEAAIAAAHEVLATPISLWGRARMYSQLGIALLGAWNLDGAWDAFLKEYEAYTDLGGPVNAASSAGNLAEVALRRGDERAAAHYQRIALDLALQLGTPLMLGFSLIVAARIVAARGDWATAATLHRQADLILESTGLILYEDDQRLSDEMLKQAREALGPDGYAAAVASAEPLDVPAAAALADDVLSAAEAGERGS